MMQKSKDLKNCKDGETQTTIDVKSLSQQTGNQESPLAEDSNSLVQFQSPGLPDTPHNVV